MAAAVAIGTMCAGATYAMDPERALSQYLRDRWGSDRGFPGGPIHAITQTPDGYLWIAADKGLVRFDGLNFKLFQPSGLTSGTGPTALGLAVDPDGNLWARLRGAALVRYRNGAFEHVMTDAGLNDVVISAMINGARGSIFLSALGQGTLEFAPGRVTTIVPARATPSSFVIAMAQGADGELWLGTRDSGLLRVHAGTTTTITKGLPDQKVNSLLALPGGDLWIGTDRGVVRWSGTETTSAGIPAALADVAALAMMRDRAANIWIAGGARGLLRVSKRGVAAGVLDGVAALDGTAARAHASVTAVFEDRDGNLWVGTTEGLERWRDGVFTTYAAAQGLPAAGVGPVYVDPSGRTWFGSTDGGLLWLRDGHLARVTDAGLDTDIVYSIAGDGEDIWVGRQRGGLTRLRPAGAGFTVTNYTQREGLAQNNVYAVHRARDGAVWAGTLSGGVSRYEKGVFTTYTAASGLASNTVASIVDGRDGRLWFATPNGVSTLHEGRWRRYAIEDGLPANDANVVFQDSAGSVWIGTAAGLAVFRDGALRPVRDVPAPLRGSILGLAEDTAGWLWIATAEGLLRAPRDRLGRERLGGADVVAYDAADGLVAFEGVKRHRTVTADSRGRIWLATGRGLAMADPSHANAAAPPAIVHVEEIAADGRVLDARQPVRLQSGRHRLTFTYAGLSLGVPERVRYRYRLDGFDPEWSEPVPVRQAVYTNLAPGDYTFRVLASNSDGLWSPTEARVAFEVEPMLWQSTWFRLTLLVMAGAAGWGVYRMRVRQVARGLNARFEARLAERTRIAQELHDTLLQGFLSASMQLQVAAERVAPDSPAKAPLAHVIARMGQVIEEGRNAVRGLRASSAGADDLEQAFCRIPKELPLESSAAFRVIVEGQPRPLHAIIRDEVYRIGREAVVNAYRHAAAASIEVEIDYGAARLRVLVRDNGRGIDEQVLRAGRDGHWGLPGMRERAERIGAQLKVWSRPNAGTEVDLSVPGHIAFPSAARLSRARRSTTATERDE